MVTFTAKQKDSCRLAAQGCNSQETGLKFIFQPAKPDIQHSVAWGVPKQLLPINQLLLTAGHRK